ncbi:hypothetical protein PUR71_08290 [Streptomyces sp. SP17BM10]|uniref:hypothetical protein n=1 Tax=Streptomyces sp. SP17BM10 TaxID=3002530 RepID=UPI002E773C3D|nr:hypothetical protein [Streptomyces sp. SP17BM10]MEE1782914.1 hypothetical protein [Streptomyces sp. SP17BM10]
MTTTAGSRRTLQPLALAEDPGMYRRTEAPLADQIADSYRRLHAVNAATDAAALAADPRRLAALHAWAAPLDGGLTVLAGIHYNLFLGSLLLAAGDLTPARVRELMPLTERSVARLADHPRTLVDAFDLPEAFFATRPIAGQAYQEVFTA